MTGPKMVERANLLTELDGSAQDLLLGLSAYPSVHRRGLGDKIDEMSVAVARDVVVSIDKELARMKLVEQALLELREQITGSVE